MHAHIYVEPAPCMYSFIITVAVSICVGPSLLPLLSLFFLPPPIPPLLFLSMKDTNFMFLDHPIKSSQSWHNVKEKKK